MSDKFFDEEEKQVTEPEKIKLGEDEYTQEELQHLVGLGKIGAEAEEKYKTKIDRVWPEFTKKSQQISDYEQKIAEYEQKLKTQSNPVPQQPVNGLTEEQRRLAIEQAEVLGIGPRAMEERFRAIVREENAAKDLISDVNSVLSEAEANGQPKSTVEDILRHMQEQGFKNPQKAYKDMFENELDQWKETRLKTLKPSGMATTERSVAGSKYPTQPKPPANRSELLKAVADAFNTTES